MENLIFLATDAIDPSISYLFTILLGIFFLMIPLSVIFTVFFIIKMKDRRDRRQAEENKRLKKLKADPDNFSELTDEEKEIIRKHRQQTANSEEPNAETLAAFEEYDKMIDNPEEYKRYSSFKDAMDDTDNK